MANDKNQKGESVPAEQLPLFGEQTENSEMGRPPEYVKPEHVQAIFQRHGKTITREQAEAVLVYFRRFITFTSHIR